MSNHLIIIIIIITGKQKPFEEEHNSNERILKPIQRNTQT